MAAMNGLGRGLAAAALLAACAGPASAQRLGTDVFAYLGYSRATLTAADVDLGERWVNGATGGVGLRHPLTGPVGLRTELLLARRGGAFGLAVAGEDVLLSLDLVYLEVPLQLQFQSYDRGRRFRPFAFAGLVPGFRIGCDAELRMPSVGVLQDACTEVLTAQPEWFDLGATGGVGIEVRRGRTLLQLQARYFQSLGDIGSDLAVRNRTFAILLGVGM
jgi:hypothetical protein